MSSDPRSSNFQVGSHIPSQRAAQDPPLLLRVLPFHLLKQLIHCLAYLPVGKIYRCACSVNRSCRDCLATAMKSLQGRPRQFPIAKHGQCEGLSASLLRFECLAAMCAQIAPPKTFNSEATCAEKKAATPEFTLSQAFFWVTKVLLTQPERRAARNL